MPKASGLGRGLSSLIPKQFTKSEGVKKITKELEQRILDIDIEKITTNPMQPRREFSTKDMEELINSIKEHGIITPLIVTKSKGGSYELIAGERRLRAAKSAGLKTVPALIRSSRKQEKLELALIENLQRTDLNPIEEAWAYKKLIDDFNMSHREVAKRIGKSRSVVTNTIRILELPNEIQKAIVDGKISVGHARAIAGLLDAKEQLKLFKHIIQNQLNVHQAERFVQNIKRKKTPSSLDLNLREKEKRLEQALSTKVRVISKGKKGKIVIEFYSEEELADIIRKIVS